MVQTWRSSVRITEQHPSVQLACKLLWVTNAADSLPVPWSRSQNIAGLGRAQIELSEVPRASEPIAGWWFFARDTLSHLVKHSRSLDGPLTCTIRA